MGLHAGVAETSTAMSPSRAVHNSPNSFGKQASKLEEQHHQNKSISWSAITSRARLLIFCHVANDDKSLGKEARRCGGGDEMVRQRRDAEPAAQSGIYNYFWLRRLSWRNVPCNVCYSTSRPAAAALLSGWRTLQSRLHSPKHIRRYGFIITYIFTTTPGPCI